jgi:hypothetical protein
MSLTNLIAKLTGEKIMPLKKGYGKKSVSYNIKKEMKSGKSRKAICCNFIISCKKSSSHKKKKRSNVYLRYLFRSS